MFVYVCERAFVCVCVSMVTAFPKCFLQSKTAFIQTQNIIQRTCQDRELEALKVVLTNLLDKGVGAGQKQGRQLSDTSLSGNCAVVVCGVP